MNNNGPFRQLACVGGLLVLCMLVPRADAQSWRDKLKEKAEQAKEKLKESERRCEDCGKTIHVGTVCASCLAKRAAEKAKATEQKAREAWRESADKRQDIQRRITDGGRAIQGGWRDSADDRQRLVERLRQGAEQTRSFARDLQTEFRDRQPELRGAWDQASHWAAAHQQIAARYVEMARSEYGPRVIAAARDPENQRLLFETIGALQAAHSQFSRVEQKATYELLTIAGHIPVDTPQGRTTLKDIARQRMLEQLPMLRGTPLADDPAAPLAHLLTGDRSYFFEEMPLVDLGGRKVSVREAMIESSPFDTNEVMKCLAVYEAADDVAHAIDSGEGGLEAIESTLNAIETVHGK